MNEQELRKDILKLQGEITDLRRIVMRQCVAIMDIMDDNAMIKKWLRENTNITINENNDELYGDRFLKALAKIYEDKFTREI